MKVKNMEKDQLHLGKKNCENPAKQDSLSLSRGISHSKKKQSKFSNYKSSEANKGGWLSEKHISKEQLKSVLAVVRKGFLSASKKSSRSPLGIFSGASAKDNDHMRLQGEKVSDSTSDEIMSTETEKLSDEQLNIILAKVKEELLTNFTNRKLCEDTKKALSSDRDAMMCQTVGENITEMEIDSNVTSTTNPNKQADNQEVPTKLRALISLVLGNIPLEVQESLDECSFDDVKCYDRKSSCEDSRIVHLPAKLCFHCKKNCQKAALIECDLCPLLYHAKCLDPPLAHLPNQWICPSHPRPIKDQVMKSLNQSERVCLWNQFTDAQNTQDTRSYKINFLEQLKSKITPDQKTYSPPNTVIVPPDIVKLYNSPPLKLPRNRKVGAVTKCESSDTTNDELKFMSSITCFQAELAESIFYSDAAKNEIAVTSDSGIKDLDLHTSSRLKKVVEELKDVNKSSVEIAEAKLAILLTHGRMKEHLKIRNKKISENFFKKENRAILCPINRNGDPVYMFYHTFTLGQNPSMSLCFEKYGFCEFASSHHATIFYDEITKQYELINYSSHGTIVDNILYGTDDREQSEESQACHSSQRSQMNLFHRSGKSSTSHRSRQSSPEEEKDPKSCWCISPKEVGVVKCAGTAQLHHGSCIQCGCLQFIFTICEQGARMEKIGQNFL